MLLFSTVLSKMYEADCEISLVASCAKVLSPPVASFV